MTTALLTNLEKKTLVTNCDDSSGTRMVADAKAMATMLPMEPWMKMVRPMIQVRLVQGSLSAPGSFAPIACRF